MASLSEKLRRERELRGISLKQISDDTRIGVRFLQALEDDRLDLIPGEFYRRSYLRAYARYLGLDEDRAVNDYAFSQTEKPPSERAEEVDVATSLPVWLVWMGVGVVAVIAALWLVRADATPVAAPSMEPAARASVSGPEPEPQAEPPPETDATGTSAVPVLAPAPDPRPTPPRAAPPPIIDSVNGGLRLTVGVVESCWLEIQADGSVVATGLKEVGYRRDFVATQELRLWLGNAGGVSLWINGRAVKPLGRPGQVRKDLSFTIDNYLDYVGDNVS